MSTTIQPWLTPRIPAALAQGSLPGGLPTAATVAALAQGGPALQPLPASLMAVTVTIPAGVTPVAVAVAPNGNVYVTNGATSNVTVIFPAPTVTSISPAQGPATGGTVVTITGTNLSGATVTFNGNAATNLFYNADGTQMIATTPGRCSRPGHRDGDHRGRRRHPARRIHLRRRPHHIQHHPRPRAGRRRHVGHHHRHRPDRRHRHPLRPPGLQRHRQPRRHPDHRHHPARNPRPLPRGRHHPERHQHRARRLHLPRHPGADLHHARTRPRGRRHCGHDHRHRADRCHRHLQRRPRHRGLRQPRRHPDHCHPPRPAAPEPPPSPSPPPAAPPPWPAASPTKP